MSYWIIFFCLLSFACPKLTGNYECHRGYEISKKWIQENDLGFEINEHGLTTQYFTDAKERSLADQESFKDAKVKSYCEKDQFIIEFKATILYEGSPIAKQVSKTIFERTEDDVKITKKTKMKGLPLPTITEICYWE